MAKELAGLVRQILRKFERSSSESILDLGLDSDVAASSSILDDDRPSGKG